MIEACRVKTVEEQQHDYFVTGATSGFGEAIARRFIREGHQVIAAGRRLERLEALQEELGQALHIVRLDVRNRAAIQQAIEALPAELRQIDVLVNTPGWRWGWSRRTRPTPMTGKP